MDLHTLRSLHQRVLRMETLYLVDIDSATSRYTVGLYRGSQRLDPQAPSGQTPVEPVVVKISERQAQAGPVKSEQGGFATYPLPDQVRFQQFIRDEEERAHHAKTVTTSMVLLPVFQSAEHQERVAMLRAWGYKDAFTPTELQTWLDLSPLYKAAWGYFQQTPEYVERGGTTRDTTPAGLPGKWPVDEAASEAACNKTQEVWSATPRMTTLPEDLLAAFKRMTRAQQDAFLEGHGYKGGTSGYDEYIVQYWLRKHPEYTRIWKYYKETTGVRPIQPRAHTRPTSLVSTPRARSRAGSLDPSQLST